ncbi:cytochrome b [Bosea sp. PAMC 26642]|uniref:cytochrome b n=1 Tax=Bosea sp. (strain PAMC 26642) TaxID=1792307 RepID=UPI00076FE648|nr:cytochrome b [Bosea sp. PAMC 26642]AMJ60892.1 hypothetical protein AXW83_11830 [Bosea sp. PAMC 26642]
MGDHDPATTEIYSGTARHLHWVTAAAVFVMIPLGFAMTYRGNTLNIWDGVTDALFSTHKLIGFLLLWLIVGRFAYRLIHGAPKDEPTLLWWQKAASHLVHWLLYGLLLVVPALGWIGVSLYPSLGIFGLFNLPALVKPDQALAEAVLQVHGNLAILIALLVGGHIAAALYHHLIRKDGVLRRMLPGLGR